MFIEDFILSHPVREPPKNIIDGDPHAANTRLSVPLVGLDHNALIRGHHNLIMAQPSLKDSRDFGTVKGKWINVLITDLRTAELLLAAKDK